MDILEKSIKEIIKIKEGCYDKKFESFFIEYVKETDRRLIDSLPLSSCMKILDEITVDKNLDVKSLLKCEKYNIFDHINEGCKY